MKQYETYKNDGLVKNFDEFEKLACEKLIIKRFGKTQEIGYACLFFGSNESQYCTGVCLCVDGGYNAL